MRPAIRARLCITLAGGLLCLATAGPLAAEDGASDLGRLFSTPEERARIDEARRLSRLPPPPVVEPEVELVEEAPPPEPEAPPPPPPRGMLRVDGYVLRGDGPPTVWVNGESSPGGPLLGAEASVRPPRRPGEGVTIETADGSRALLRPGQTLAEGEALVQEAWDLPPAGEATGAAPAVDGSTTTRPEARARSGAPSGRSAAP